MQLARRPIKCLAAKLKDAAPDDTLGFIHLGAGVLLVISAILIAWKRRQRQKCRACEIGTGNHDVDMKNVQGQEYSPVGQEKEPLTHDENPIVGYQEDAQDRQSVAVSDEARSRMLHGSV